MPSLIKRSKERPRSSLAEYTYNLMTENGPDLGCLNDYAIEIIEFILKDFYKLPKCSYYIDPEQKQIIIHVYDKDDRSFIFKPKYESALRFLEHKLERQYKIRFATREDVNEQTKRLF